MEQVMFINMEDTGTDLILSFALGTSGYDIRSLILMRTPKYEPLLEEWERGVSVSLEGEFEEDLRILKAFKVQDRSVIIETHQRAYQLNLSKVDLEEMKAMNAFIARMNFDHSFFVEDA